MYTARFEFSSDRASEFTLDGQYVSSMDFDSVEDIIEITEQFESALVDVNVFCHDTGRTINLSDFTYSI